MAFLEFLVAAAWARIVATYVFQRVTHWLLMGVTAVRAMDVAVLVVVMIMIVVAIRTMNMGLLVHRVYSAIKSTRALSRKWSLAVSPCFFLEIVIFFKHAYIRGVKRSLLFPQAV